MELAAVVFDLDDTLLLDEEITREAFAAAGEAAARRVGADAARFAGDAAALAGERWRALPAHARCVGLGIAAPELLWGDFADDPELRPLIAPFRRGVFGAALAAQGLSGDGTIEAAAFETARRGRQRLLPGAVEVLERLAGRVRLAMLTNGNPGLQRAKIAQSGLEGFFDAIVVSGEVGIGKPDPGVFARLLDRLGVPAAGAAMVGNSLARDIMGARAAGFGMAVWLRVPGAEEFADVAPDAVIERLAELPAALGLG